MFRIFKHKAREDRLGAYIDDTRVEVIPWMLR